MTISPRMQDLRHAAVAVGLAFALLTIGGAGAAFAQDQDQQEDPYQNHILNTDKRIFDGFLSVFGLAPSSSNATITYRERSPLVVPPSADLPPPEKSNLAKNPAWPVDPEIRQRKLEAELDAKAAAVDDGAPITGTSQDIRYKAPAEVSANGLPFKKKKEPNFLSALLNGTLPMGQKDETAKFTGEPPRQTLTEPPPGYLTPSPDAPYGVTKRP